MTWPTPFAWLGMVGTLATLTSLVLAWGARDTKKMLAEMDRSTTALLARMETNAEARYRDLKDRLDSAEEG
jgi:hypothetical protein